jgi:hypothetical protein
MLPCGCADLSGLPLIFVSVVRVRSGCGSGGVCALCNGGRQNKDGVNVEKVCWFWRMRIPREIWRSTVEVVEREESVLGKKISGNL